MDSAIGKAIELAWQYTVEPLAHQFKYVFCYKSCVAEMNDALTKLENEKEIVYRQKTEAELNMRLIHTKASDWLEAVTRTQEEVSSLMMYEDGKAKVSCCGRNGVTQIVNPCTRHKLGRKAIKKKQAIEELHSDRPRPDEISYAPLPPGIVDHEATSDVVASAAAKQQTEDGVFRSSLWKQIMEKIMTALTDERNNVVGLYGMGGVGKSTMINEVYDQVKKQCMFDEVIKIEVKVKPEIRRIQWEIAFQLGLKFESECSSTIRADLLRERLLKTEKKEKKKRVLIILDDLWDKLDLREVGIPLGGNDKVQIKLLLTSREEYLLLDKMGARNAIHLDVLNDADALRMFRFVVGGGAEGINDEKVTEIARRCSGLPIVIEATAKALKDRPLVEWEKILKRLDNDDVLEKLKVSYDYLPSKESKDLFLICGISRGPNIQVRDLLKYTFGLRLYNQKDRSTLGVAAVKLEELLSRLEGASMLLKSDDNRYVKIHDHMRQLAFKIVKEDHPEWAHDITLSDNCSEFPNASELKLLLSLCKGDAVELQDSFLKGMEQLNVLEFTNVRVTLRLTSSTTQLNHMRNLGTLCFHNCCLGDISMIGELKGLQILSFRGSDIRKLPIQLRELILLKMLDLSDCKKLTQIEPNVLGSLIKLEELNMENSFKNWEISQEDDAPPTNARLIELENMSSLSNVRIHIPCTSMLPKDGRLFSSKLSMYMIEVGRIGYGRNKFSSECIKSSRVLMLTLDEDSSDIIYQDWVQTTMKTTEALYLSGYVDGKCKSVSDMCTEGFECLKHLYVKKCPSFQYIISSNVNSSTNLESLVLSSLESLESLCDGLPRHEEVFSKLRVVNAYGCNKLRHLFDFSLLKSPLSSQLENISVISCAEIQCIVVGNNNDVVTMSNLQNLIFVKLCKFSSFCAAGQSSNVLFTGKKVAFPFLETLIIENLYELEHIWDPTDPPAVLGNLRLLHVYGCDKLVRAINSNVLMTLQENLKSLIIYECGSMKEVFDVDDGIIRSYCTDDEHHLVLFPRVKELRLRYMNGNMMMMKGGMSSMTIFPNIESLDVSCCSLLRYLLCCSLPTTAGVGGGRGVYENLKEISIRYCDEMEAIVLVKSGTVDHHHHDQNYDHDDDQNCVSISYSSLKEMIIECCSQLRTFGQYLPSSEHDSVANHNLPFFSQKEIFPCLESLDFGNLSKMGEIWPHEVPSDESSFKMLKRVKISYCAELSVVFPSTLIPRLENLTWLKVEDCEVMRRIIMDVGGSNSKTEMMFTFPSLTIMYLGRLSKLDRFYSSSSSAAACGFQFSSLESLEIKRCDGLKTLFSGDSDMQIGGSLFTYSDVMQLVPIGVGTYVTELEVFSCDGLEYLFTHDGAASLVHLTRLHIERCESMKAVIVAGPTANKENDEQGGGEAIIGDDHHIPDINTTFHQLNVLKLKSLPRLEKFSSVDNMVLNFPSLETLYIYNCPKMNAFSRGIATASAPEFERDLNSYFDKNYNRG